MQHLEGGIVSEILVTDGQLVEQGQTLLILDNTQSKAELGILKGQYFTTRAMENRLAAERDSLESVDFSNDLDADDMLEQKQASQKAGNEYRIDQGLEPMFIDGWVKPPFYNPDTNNLEWGLKIRVEDNYNVNYISKLLGRKGVMDATLVCGTEEMEAILPVFQGLLTSYEYVDGQKYAEYTSGDKIAKYGLTALVVGAGATIAAKAGLFAKFWKFIVAGFVALIAGVKRLFGTGKE